ncbi:hypothetical protein E2C00_01500 [Streptomyces sp. WAC05374]|uniref:hypothetical protein n=1 Tax=Streptomyces sp. WAC05374 TaxID=2487420 RepID=UPI000F89C2C4|nr:hypothetical protein [Streptomyces sp. WAC05374]RST17533.1 hypothetical protein EF905_08995 [Streptomyces sp. WAC05374]TDF50216.1 hypothetical protein E2B92_01475 [Streptomyces sp. WAC05374]TDF57940.1 hypothetical protein E2C02_09265 [Streptomyces sp. WAC05374]TDF60469.1 hypothetical protein E2C00_01500 [Streptomyces sp. WAC05374]
MTTTPSTTTFTTTTFTPATEARLAVARRVADAVLFEGYVLYPYRASAAKNRLRWQFGVLVPPAWTARAEEHDFQHTELLMEPRRGAELAVEVRFLHTQRRTVQRPCPDGTFETVAELRLDDQVVVPWDEGHEQTVRLTVPVESLAGEGITVPFTRPAAEETEPVTDSAGRVVGRLVRRREEVGGALRLSAAELEGPYRTYRLSLVVENTSGWTPDGDADRDAALPRSLVATHALLCLDSGRFLSMTDPPEWARGAAAACRNLHTWPVLAGEPGRGDLVLSSPIILEDHPAIAPESPGALYDATEIDEILALRTAALTDEEKREARGTDARAAAVIDLADSMPPEVLERLHGAVRGLREVTAGAAPPATAVPSDPFRQGGVTRPDTPWWDPGADATVDPATDHVLVGGRPVRAGSRVVLRPRLRRTDAQDLFLSGRSALVEAVLHDVDGGVHIAVTVEDDPGADIRREQGRFLYFQPDEVDVMEDA